jgi:hypothetical protein
VSKVKHKLGNLLRAVMCLMGLGALLGLLVFSIRIWSWEPAQLSRGLLLETARALGCRLEVQETEVRKFPFPRVLWGKTSLFWGENTHAQVESLGAGPDLLSMAMGRLRVSYLELTGLEASHDSGRKLLEGLWASMERNLQVPFFDLRLSNGKVNTRLAGEEQVLLSNLGGRLNRRLSGVDLRLSFDLEGRGKGLLLRGVVLQFSASGDLGSALKGKIRVQEPLLDLTAEIKGLSRESFDEFLLTSPPLDLGSARSLLQVFQRALPIPPELWERLEAGIVLDLEAKIPGKSQDLSRGSQQAQLRGRLKEGKLLLPSPWGVLKDLEAAFELSGDTLELSSLRAKAGAGSLKSGSLRLGLTSPEHNLFAQAWFEADLRQLHRILGEWLPEEPLGMQIRALYKVGGRARGKLVLEGPGASPRVWLEVQEFDFVARHKEFPYAIAIGGGSLLARPGELAFEGLRGTLGSSSFSELSGSLDLSAEPWLDLRVGPCVLELEEIWAILQESKAAWGLPENLSSLEGRLKIREAEINGPLLEPRTWKGRASASMEGRLARDLLGVQVEIKGAELELSQESLSLRKAGLDVEGERLYLEGDLLHWMNEEKRGELLLWGHIGPETWGILRKPLTELTGINWRELPRAELLPSKFNWSPEGVSVGAELAWADKMRVSANLLLGQGGLKVRELWVQDPETRIFFSLDTAPGSWELGLKGYISGSTLDFFTEENPLGRGWVSGEAKIKRDPAGRFVLHGEIMAEAIPLARFLEGGPWALIQGRLLGKGREIFLEGARLTWMDKEILLRGEGSFWKTGAQVRVSLETVALGWEELGEITQELTSGVGTSLAGSLGLRLGQLRVGEASFRPFHADLELDPSGSGLDLKYALLCGVTLSGRVQKTEPLTWTLHPVARAIHLKEFLGCLGVTSIGLSGKVDLDGEIRGEGFEPHSMERASGSIEMLLHKGEIQPGRLWLRILEVLKGLPEFRDWTKRAGPGGLGWDKGRTNLELNEGNLRIKELWLDGSLMQVLAQGDLDLLSGGLHMEILIEPKGIKSGGSKASKPGRPLAALALEGSLQEPRVHMLQPGEIPKEFLKRLVRPQAPTTKTSSNKKTRGTPAK